MVRFRPQLQKLEDRVNPAPLTVPPVPLSTAAQSITNALQVYQMINMNGQAILNNPQLRTLAQQQASQAIGQLITGLQAFAPLARAAGGIEALQAVGTDGIAALQAAGANNAEQNALLNVLNNLATPLADPLGGIAAVNTQSKAAQVSISIANQIQAGNNLLAALSTINGFLVGIS